MKEQSSYEVRSAQVGQHAWIDTDRILTDMLLCFMMSGIYGEGSSECCRWYREIGVENCEIADGRKEMRGRGSTRDLLWKGQDCRACYLMMA